MFPDWVETGTQAPNKRKFRQVHGVKTTIAAAANHPARERKRRPPAGHANQTRAAGKKGRMTGRQRAAAPRKTPPAGAHPPQPRRAASTMTIPACSRKRNTVSVIAREAYTINGGQTAAKTAAQSPAEPRQGNRRKQRRA